MVFMYGKYTSPMDPMGYGYGWHTTVGFFLWADPSWLFLEGFARGPGQPTRQLRNRVEATKFPENARVAIGEFASHQKFMHPKFGTAKVEVEEAAAFLTANQDSVDILVHVRSSISYGKLKIMHW